MWEVTWTARVCATAAGCFLMLGLATGIWKYVHMLESSDHEAPVYVNIAHRASLMYSFACLVLGTLAAGSIWPEWVDGVAAITPIFFFAAAVATYVWLGLTRPTTNQFEERTWHTTWGMWALIVGEVGGTVCLFIGFVRGVWLV